MIQNSNHAHTLSRWTHESWELKTGVVIKGGITGENKHLGVLKREALSLNGLNVLVVLLEF